MKHTEVEWLLEQLENQVSDDGKQTMSLKVTGFLRDQAKEMEKKQIIDSYEDGNYENGMGICEPEQYYNETFKNK